MLAVADSVPVSPSKAGVSSHEVPADAFEAVNIFFHQEPGYQDALAECDQHEVRECIIAALG